METQSLYLPEHVPNFPPKYHNEIPRDTLIRFITETFGQNCQKQLIVSERGTGKTNFLGQFCRHHSEIAISYFINSNPLSQNTRQYLYVILNQIALSLGKPPLTSGISIEELKNILPNLTIELSKRCRRNKQPHYIVIDGIDHCLLNNRGLDILDNIPLTYSNGPYILISVQPETITRLPESLIAGITIHDNMSTTLIFNENDTKYFFKDLDLTDKELAEIHNKAGGLPQYLRYLYKSIKSEGKAWLESEEIPHDLENIIQRQIEQYYTEKPEDITRLLEYLSVSSAPIPIPLLEKVEGSIKSINSKDFTGLAFVQKNAEENSLAITSEIARQIVTSKLGKKKDELVGRLIDISLSLPETAGRLTDVLLKEHSDYQRIEKLLGKHNIVHTLNDTNDLLDLSNRIQTAFEMAKNRNDIFEMARWGRLLSTWKSLHKHSLYSREIKALIAIQEFEEALKKIYLVPDIIARTRLLGKTYSEMEKNGVNVAKDQIDELRTLVGSINADEIGKDLARDIAADVFEIVPDEAMGLLERTTKQAYKRDLLETETNKAYQLVGEEIDDKTKAIVQPSIGFGKEIIARRFSDLSFSELIVELDDINKTRAKEYVLRRWCLANKDDTYLADAINYWIDIIVGDSNYTISLKSVRQLTEIVKGTDTTRIRGLISRIETLLYNSIKSPLEEWYSIKLGLAEALSIIDIEEAKKRLLDLYVEINLNVEDKDILIYCYARVWKAAHKFLYSLEDEVKRNFHRVLSILLDDSANQWEMLKRPIIQISAIDTLEAFEVAKNLNTKRRRYKAIGNVIIHGVIENPKDKIPDQLLLHLNSISPTERYSILRLMLNVLWDKGQVPSEENQGTLLRLSRTLDEPMWRAKCLGYLSGIWSFNTKIRTKKLINEAIRSWKDIKDLRTKIAMGFELVEIISTVDQGKGASLFSEVQDILLQPGASLAIGRLGVTYRRSIDLTITSLCKNDFDTKQDRPEQIVNFISRLPSNYVRCELYSQLAAKAYTIGNHSAANKIIKNRMIPELDQLYSHPQYWRILYYAIPILLKYHKETAEKYLTGVSEQYKNIAWYVSIVWQITLGRLGTDFYVERIKNTSTYPVISDKVSHALKKIESDNILYSSIIAITKCIEQSVIHNEIDGTQAYDLFNTFDEIIKRKLPDKRNIKHAGYLIVAQARIHSARSIVYNHLRIRGRFSKVDIRKKWSALSNAANKIQNVADRALVLITLAKEYANYNKDGAVEYLHRADEDLNKIPSIIDRSDRMQMLLEMWGAWGYDDQAQYLIQKQEELLKQFEGYSRDQVLERLVQSIYTFDPKLAENVADSFYARDPESAYNPMQFNIEAKELSKTPNRIVLLTEKYPIREFQKMIVDSAIDKLLRAQAVNDYLLPTRESLREWVSISHFFDENIHFNILRWVTECLSQKTTQTEFIDLGDYFLDATFLVEALSRWSSPARHEGIPKDLNQYLPGMEGRIHVFKEGEVEKAKTWVKKWINENAREYIKIVDPYFGLNQLEYISSVPNDCKVLIVTTDSKLKYNDADELEREVKAEWKLLGKGTVPRMTLLIVPRQAEGQFHCRAIVTDQEGLDIGQSLNGLGLKTGKLTSLPSEDSRELEMKYVNDMLDHNSWFIKLDTHPLTAYISP